MIDSKGTLVVVDDDALTCTRLKSYFEKEGYCVFIATNGEEMWEILNNQTVSLVMLDIGLPGKDGFQLAREVRSQHEDLALILVTGRDDEVDKIVGLESGADDYVTKPFNSRELLARVKNLLRRSKPIQQDMAVGSHKFHDWTIDIKKRRLSNIEGKRVVLTRGEFDLLSSLVQHSGVILSRERLMQTVCHRGWDPTDRTIDVLVRRLRSKIEVNADDPEIITTVRGEGYVFTADLD